MGMTMQYNHVNLHEYHNGILACTICIEHYTSILYTDNQLIDLTHMHNKVAKIQPVSYHNLRFGQSQSQPYNSTTG